MGEAPRQPPRLPVLPVKPDLLASRRGAYAVKQVRLVLYAGWKRVALQAVERRRAVLHV